MSARITPLVSVIIPCFNCEEVVKAAVNSVLAQTYSNIELLLVDNNSTDATLTTLRAFEEKYPEKVLVLSEKKAGACAARNLGMRNANGMWMQFLDADDELLPSKLEEQVELVVAYEADLIVGAYRQIQHLNRSGKTRLISKEIIPEEDPWIGLISSRLGITSANLWKKDALFQVDGWDEGLSSSQEYDLLFRLLKLQPKVIISHHVLTVVHAHGESVSRAKDHNKLHSIYFNRYNLRCNVYNYLNAEGLLDSKYERNLCLYLYYHLLLIGELNIDYFKEHVGKHDFSSISIKDKLKLLIDLLRHSAKRKYAHANLVLKLVEWQFHFIKNIRLLFYSKSFKYVL